MEVRGLKGSAVYLLVFYGVFCMVPSKTNVFLLLWASRPPWAPYWDPLDTLGSPIVPHWCPLGLPFAIIGLLGAPHWALLHLLCYLDMKMSNYLISQVL